MAPPADQDTRRHGPPPPEAPSAVDVIVTDGADAGKKATLDGAQAKIVLGTSPLCELRLADVTVSRRHASLEWTERGLLVTDLGSTNGTFVGDARIVAAYVAPGASLRLGATQIEIRARAGEPKSVRRVASLGRMASSAPRMMNVLALCAKLAPTDVAVVLEGETGTGKELLAECMHEASGRAKGPFVVLDCRTTPRDLLDAHLFGEARADGSARPGIFEMASGGTLFIDEPGDLDLDAQAKLLRALDRGVVTRLGDPAPVKVDVRAIVATSRDLDKLVEEGKFREDLCYRLAGARVEVPPLRRRREDVPLLAAEMWTDLGGKGHLPDEVLERFEGYDWPGNVRELEAAIERFLALGDKVSLLVSSAHRHVARPDLQPREGGSTSDVMSRVLAMNLGYSDARRRMLDEFEREYMQKALADHGGNVAQAAAASGIARRHFQRIRARQK